MKCFDVRLDPPQFAFKQGCGTNDAINTIAHLVTRHLKDLKAYAQVFVDFSSAFNTLRPYLLIGKMEQRNVNPY